MLPSLPPEVPPTAIHKICSQWQPWSFSTAPPSPWHTTAGSCHPPGWASGKGIPCSPDSPHALRQLPCRSSAVPAPPPRPPQSQSGSSAVPLSQHHTAAPHSPHLVRLLKVYLKTKKMTDISQAQDGFKAKSRRNLLWIPRTFNAKSRCVCRNRRYFRLFSCTIDCF